MSCGSVPRSRSQVSPFEAMGREGLDRAIPHPSASATLHASRLEHPSTSGAPLPAGDLAVVAVWRDYSTASPIEAIAAAAWRGRDTPQADKDDRNCVSPLSPDS